MTTLCELVHACYVLTALATGDESSPARIKGGVRNVTQSSLHLTFTEVLARPVRIRPPTLYRAADTRWFLHVVPAAVRCGTHSGAVER